MQQKRAQNRAKALNESSKRRDEELATMSNPDSNVDELAKAIRYFFLPLASFWVGYIGYLFTIQELNGLVSPITATLLAIALPLFVQILKVYGATKALRAFHFKWYDRSGHDLWFWVVTGLIVVLMFFWSLKISIFDINDSSKESFIAQNSDSLSVLLAANTAAIDAQIKSIQESSNEASGMRTKRGKIAYTGQSIKMENASTLSDLNAQRTVIANQTIEDYKENKTRLQKGAEHRGNFFQRFGGLGEGIEILMLLLLGLVEAINRRQNAERLENTESEGEKVMDVKNDPLNEFKRHSPTYNNSTSAKPIGFFSVNPHRQTVPQSPPPVPQSPQVISSTMVLGCNQVLLQLKGRLQSDLPNLRAGNGSKQTIHNRIVKAFDQAFEIIRHNDFQPDRIVGIQVYNYLIDAIAALNSMGWPYERDVFFLKRLSDILEATEQPV